MRWLPRLGRALRVLSLATRVCASGEPRLIQRLLLIVMLVIVTAVLMALTPFALKALVDRLVSHRGALSPPFLLVSVYVACYSVARILTEIRTLIFARLERRLFSRLCERAFAHVMQLPLTFHLRRATGALTQILQNGLDGYQMVLRLLLLTAGPILVELLTILVIIGQLRAPILLVCFSGALLAYTTVYTISMGPVVQAYRSAATARVDVAAAITDGILNYETVKLFTAEAAIQDRVSQAAACMEREWIRFHVRSGVRGLLNALLIGTLFSLAAFYTCREVWHGRMTPGEFVLVNTYVLELARPLEMLGVSIQELIQGVTLVDRLMQLFEEPTESRDEAHSGRAPEPAAIEFRAVSASYDADRPVLHNVSFTVPAGKSLGIVGASGAGKSTIVRLLTRMIEPCAGDIRLDGHSLRMIPLCEVRRTVAVVPQDAVLFYASLRYNISLGDSRYTSEQIERATRVAGLASFIASLPQGYDTLVGERGVRLSGGERQRVSIARAALKGAPIYVFDEATSSLDSALEREILTNLRSLAATSTTVIIAHRLSSLMHADEIIVVENGTVTERGVHRRLLQSKGRYYRLWCAQQAQAATKRKRTVTLHPSI